MLIDHINIAAPFASHGIEYRLGYIQEFNMTQLFFKEPAGTGLEVNFPGES